MTNRTGLTGGVILLVLGLATAPVTRGTNPAETNWPSFRGLNAGGVAEGYPLPIAWDVPASKNVLWRTRIPGLGLSSPVIWGNRLFVSTAVSGVEKPEFKPGLYGDIASVKDDTVHRWIVYCVDKQSGRILWEKTVLSGVPRVKRHPKSTHANSTLATDGQHVVAFFGSEGLYCFDMDGRQIWKKDFGLLDSAFFVAPSAQWEFGSSPIIYKDMVLIQCDVLNGSFVAALNLRDGTERWRTSRDDVPSWGTPAISASGGAVQVIVNGYRHIGGYDVGTGRELWRLRGGGDIPVPTPVVGDGLVFITNAHGKIAPVYAIRLEARGDISLKGDETANQAVAWSALREGAYMATPLLYEGSLYNCRWNGVLVCYDAASGNRTYQERLGSGGTAFTASPVAGDGKIYLAGEDGDVYVVKSGPKFEVLARNTMGEVCMASPAISAGVLYFRTQSHLVAIAAKP